MNHGSYSGRSVCGMAICSSLAEPWLIPSPAGDPPAPAPELRSVAIGFWRCLRGGIGTEQQGIELGFERGEPFVLVLQPLDLVLEQLRSPLAFFLSPLALERSDLRVDCWMPV